VTTLDYRVVDVFTDQPFAGNPLAVVLGADALSSEACQTIAREFNLSETAFPVASEAADYRLRIFTPNAELPFAGHPSIGAAWVQRSLGAVSGARVVMECGAGALPLTWRSDGSIELTGGEPSVGEPLTTEVVERLLEAAGLPDFAAAPGLAARMASTGNPFTVVPVAESALTYARPSAGIEAALEGTGGSGLYLLAWTDGAAHVRMFAPGIGVAEDPATGSAATALGAYLAAEGLAPAGESAFHVSQGAEMGRPSQLMGTVVVVDGAAVECRVAGHVVPVATGTIEVPR
jgi:trans-2,3-dihydro-3-hydroxyanthranilate isomerase